MFLANNDRTSSGVCLRVNFFPHFLKYFSSHHSFGMPGPPPPPPPPAAPPPPIGGGGGGGGPAFLADIRKGTVLKKVPESQKNDRSAALVPDKGASKGNRSGMPPGGGGGVASPPKDLRAELNAMCANRFQGKPQPAPVSPQKRPPSPSHRMEANFGSPAFQARPAPGYVQPEPNVRPFPAVQPPRGSDPLLEEPGKQRAPAPSMQSPAPSPHPSKEAAYRPRAPALPMQPRAPSPYPSKEAVYRLRAPAPPAYRPRVSPNIGQGPLPPVPSRPSEDKTWESRFNFPNENTFPPPPETYRGPRTYVRCRVNEDSF
uniref:Actin binding WH2 n=1 Tax=Echinococcus granulosus TaxID=6210 RepID=A0A068WX69_ECHGR|nr:Actin binding WH2 [Echinococcus granulosus]